LLILNKILIYLSIFVESRFGLILCPIVTTVLALRKSMEAAKEVGNVLLEAKEIEIMKASEVFERTWKIFTDQENTGFSFVDASNLAHMEIRKIRKIATFDKDFLRVGSVEVVNE